MIKDGINKVETDITSFLLIGQSNMAGRGDFGEVPIIDDNDCRMFRMGRWQKMSEPINPDRAVLEGDFHSGTNLGASFAYRYKTHFGGKVGLIPCADGGTRIAMWQPGELLYDHAVMMSRLAMRTSRFGGILWHQGESDCNATDILRYKERALNMIASIRRDLGAEDLPFIFGEIAWDIHPRWNHGEYPKQMNAIFAEMEKEIPNCKLVSSRGLTMKPDGIHFDSRGLRELGNRYFDAYLALVNK
ncbi:MAG: sialate O-acetylesterase [Clostridia bacterium]|nr:sialate O-acetylesterase [Clostridia bacterium]